MRQTTTRARFASKARMEEFLAKLDGVIERNDDADTAFYYESDMRAYILDAITFAVELAREDSELGGSRECFAELFHHNLLKMVRHIATQDYHFDY